MGTEHRAALLAPTLMAAAILILFACTPRTNKPSAAEMRLVERIPRHPPGVEVEVLAAHQAGRGDAYLFFLLGRNGQVEKTATLGFGSIDLLAPPGYSSEPPDPEAAPELELLSEADGTALRTTIERAIVAATTPELFDPPSAFTRSNGRSWRRVYPAVSLRVDSAWLASENERFDGTWLMLTSPALSTPDRVVVNVIGWRYSMRRSRPLEIALSRGFLPEASVELPLHEGGKVRELIDAVRAQKLDEALPEGEPTSWRAISGTLRIEIDRAWLEGGTPPDFERWVIVDREPRS